MHSLQTFGILRLLNICKYSDCEMILHFLKTNEGGYFFIYLPLFFIFFYFIFLFLPVRKFSFMSLPHFSVGLFIFNYWCPLQILNTILLSVTYIGTLPFQVLIYLFICFMVSFDKGRFLIIFYLLFQSFQVSAL